MSKPYVVHKCNSYISNYFSVYDLVNYIAGHCTRLLAAFRKPQFVFWGLGRRLTTIALKYIQSTYYNKKTVSANYIIKTT